MASGLDSTSMNFFWQMRKHPPYRMGGGGSVKGDRCVKQAISNRRLLLLILAQHVANASFMKFHRLVLKTWETYLLWAGHLEQVEGQSDRPSMQGAHRFPWVCWHETHSGVPHTVDVCRLQATLWSDFPGGTGCSVYRYLSLPCSS